jgi:hypothetical protein
MILINKDKLVKLEHSIGKIINTNSLYEVIVVPIDYMKKIYISCAELIE